MRKKIICGVALAVTAACGDSGPSLLNWRSTAGGPDELSVQPVAPLEIPQRLTLPTPTPGGTNLADPQPGTG